MIPGNPYGAIDVTGASVMRGITLILPTSQVSEMLPPGLELGAQTLTRPGMHPVLLFFNDMIQVRLSPPTLIPDVTYREHQVGIPYVYISKTPFMPGGGPYYFMPMLYLNAWRPTIAGVTCWGFAKQVAQIDVDSMHYAVTNYQGRRVAELKSDGSGYSGGFQHLSAFPLFQPIQEILTTKIVSRIPLSLGPLFSLADVRRDWSAALLAPLNITSVHASSDDLRGFELAQHPDTPNYVATIRSSSLGVFELRVPWRMSLPYLPS